jgi:hypothetical protein
VWVTNWLLHSRAGGRGPDAQEGRRDIAGTRASLLCGLAITSAHPPLRQIRQVIRDLPRWDSDCKSYPTEYFTVIVASW